jgi:hypothetical protein
MCGLDWMELKLFRTILFEPHALLFAVFCSGLDSGGLFLSYHGGLGRDTSGSHLQLTGTAGI